MEKLEMKKVGDELKIEGVVAEVLGRVFRVHTKFRVIKLILFFKNNIII